MLLFEYAVIYLGDKEEKEDKPRILVQPTTTLASSKENAQVVAARSIPEEYLDKLDKVQVAVRPF